VLSRAREAATDLDGVVAEAELVELAVTELGEEADVEAARQGLKLKRLGHDDQEVGHCHESARSLAELARVCRRKQRLHVESECAFSLRIRGNEKKRKAGSCVPVCRRLP